MSAPPRVKVDANPLKGASPLLVTIELENLTTPASATQYDIWWGDGNSTQATSAVSGTHSYSGAGKYKIRVRIKDTTTGFYGFDQIAVQVYRVAPTGDNSSPEGSASYWPQVRPLDPTQPAFQTRRRSRPIT